MYLQFETSRVLIRPLEHVDSQGLLNLFQQLETGFFRYTPEIGDLTAAEAFIEKSILDMKDNKSVNWALIDKTSNSVLGIWHWGKVKPDEAFIYCCIAPPYMRQGYMSEVANILMSRMPEYGLKKAMAEVPSNNLEARFFMLHFGWRCVEKGTDGFEKWELIIN